MAETVYNYEKQRALPVELDFNRTLPKEVGGSEPKKTVCLPKNGTVFQPGGFTLIDLTRTPNSVLDCKHTFLRFCVTMGSSAGTDTGNVCGSAHSFIQALESFHNSVPIDNIRNYQNFAAVMLDTQMNAADRATSGNLCLGCSAIYGSAKGISVAANSVNYFSIPLLSTIAGTLTQTDLPTHDMSGFLTLRITWSSTNAIVGGALAGAAPTFTISDVELHCMMNELSESPLRLISQPTYRIATQGVWNFNTTISSGTSINQVVPFRFRDIRAIFITMRQQSVTSTFSNYCTSRDTYNINDYCFYINGRQFPPTRVHSYTSGFIDSFEEVRKAFHVPVGSLHGCGILNRTNYCKSKDVSAEGLFLIAFDCESWCGHSGEIESGFDTTHSDIVFSATFASDISAGGAMLFDAYAIYGSELVIENGQTTVVF